MFSGVCFVAGIYGVGKSTLCEKIAKELNVPFYSASDLISHVNGEQYGSNKFVHDKFLNQNILITEVNEKLKENPNMLLAGHFCILNSRQEIDTLPSYVFDKLPISKILLLEASAENIKENLYNRDKQTYSITLIKDFLQQERLQAETISGKLGCELLIHSMCYGVSDQENCVSFLEK